MNAATWPKIIFENLEQLLSFSHTFHHVIMNASLKIKPKASVVLNATHYLTWLNEYRLGFFSFVLNFLQLVSKSWDVSAPWPNHNKGYLVACECHVQGLYLYNKLPNADKYDRGFWFMGFSFPKDLLPDSYKDLYLLSSSLWIISFLAVFFLPQPSAGTQLWS